MNEKELEEYEAMKKDVSWCLRCEAFYNKQKHECFQKQ